eukprot:scaffold621_cov125-Cylindrotheca_fusiformis.AAC.1
MEFQALISWNRQLTCNLFPNPVNCCKWLLQEGWFANKTARTANKKGPNLMTGRCYRAKKAIFRCEGKETAPKDDAVKSADETTEAGKEVLKKRGLNNAAYEALLLLIDGRSVSGQVAFNIVSGCTTDEMEEGDDAKLAWSRLKKKYEPKTAPSRLMLKRKLTGMVLKNVRDDPDVWLTDLEHVKGQLIAAGSKMTDDELLEHALNSLPKEYELIVAKLEDRLGDKTEPLTIEDLCEALNLKYQRM